MLDFNLLGQIMMSEYKINCNTDEIWAKFWKYCYWDNKMNKTQYNNELIKHGITIVHLDAVFESIEKYIEFNLRFG